MALRGAARAAFPFEVTQARGADAFETWRRLKQRETGAPVIVGGEEDFDRVVDTLSDTHPRPSAREELQKAALYHFPQDLSARRAADEAAAEQRRANNPEYLAARARLAERLGLSSEKPGAPHGDWPSEVGAGPGLTVVQELHVDTATHRVSYAPYQTVYIVTLPTSDWTEAFAHLSWGGWNECPFPHEHVAAMRRWRDQYGVELVAMSGDVLNLTATRPPTTREAAMALALEQYVYCADIVDQGVGTIEALAAGLMAQDWWYFWWD